MSAAAIQRITSPAGTIFELHYGAGRKRTSPDGVPYIEHKIQKVIDVANDVESDCVEVGRDASGRTAAERAYEDGEDFVLTVFEDGYFILCPATSYPRGGRAGTGEIAGYREAAIAGTITVKRQDDLMVMTDRSKVVRIVASVLPITHRTGCGSILMNVDDGEKVVTVSRARPEFD